jgi:hypothetical protein
MGCGGGCASHRAARCVSLVALLDAKLLGDHGGGFRQASMPYMREAWRKALLALDEEARAQIRRARICRIA